MHKILNIEIKEDRNKNEMKVCTFEGVDKKVYVNSKYDAFIYPQIIVGSSHELVEDGSFLKVKYEKPTTANFGRSGGGIAKAQERKAESIATFQGNKELSIKMASTMRGALDLAIAENKPTKENIKSWRKWLWENWDAKPTDFAPFPSREDEIDVNEVWPEND